MDTVVKTRSGSVRGAVFEGVYAFKGVPFAAPPVGRGRFLPPQPVLAWRGVREALTFGAKPWQMAAPPEIEAMVPDPSVVGDDCLNLNIWRSFHAHHNPRSFCHAVLERFCRAAGRLARR